jgi:ankyrin repeat protein
MAINDIPWFSMYKNYEISKFNASFITKAFNHKIDLNCKNHNNNTLLFYAINACDTINVKLLLVKGANKFDINNKGNSAYQYAISKNTNDSAVKCIIEYIIKSLCEDFYYFILCSNNSVQFPINILQNIWKYYSQ